MVNDPALTVRARSIAAKLWGKENVEELDLRMTAERFRHLHGTLPQPLFSGSAPRVKTANAAARCTPLRSTRTNKRWITAWSRWPYSPWSFAIIRQIYSLLT